MIYLNSLIAHSSTLRGGIDSAIKRVLDRGWFVLGPEVKEFENRFSNYIGVKRTVSVANGTDAIELSLRAVGIAKDDFVATVANAGMYTTTALMAIGAKPFFIDVNINTKNTTLEECERAIKFGVKAIVITHLYGMALQDIEEIAALCKKHSVPLVEDCAQSHGAKINGKITGSFGDVAAFSFYPTKNLGALGDGGAVVTDNEEIANHVTKLRQYGWTTKYQVELPGARNSRLDEIQAAILLEFLPLLDMWNNRRRNISRAYAALIKNSKIELPKFIGEEYVAHLFVIKTSNRDSLREYLAINGVSAEVHYPVPDYRQSIFGDEFNNFSLENTEELCKSILTLPCYPEMTESDIEHISTLVNAW